MVRKYIRVLFVCIGIFLCVGLMGCSTQKNDTEKMEDLDFTVVEEDDIPKELKEIIDPKKEEPFKLTYSDQEFLYIARGYGKQKTGGYSITVNELYLTSNAIYFDTNLIGPKKNEKIIEAISYPYIVVKIEQMDKTVVFN